MIAVEKKMNITQVRDILGSLVDDVQYQNNKYVIIKHGKPAVAVVPLHIYENWKANRKRLFGLIEQMQEASGASDPDEIMDLVLEAQQAVRAEARDE
jgi:prevent-host-death family protein